MKKFEDYFAEVRIEEAVMVSGGVDSQFKQLLYDIAYLVGRFIRAVFGPKLGEVQAD